LRDCQDLSNINYETTTTWKVEILSFETGLSILEKLVADYHFEDSKHGGRDSMGPG
jgi:cyanophycinase-like exopeptidase